MDRRWASSILTRMDVNREYAPLCARLRSHESALLRRQYLIHIEGKNADLPAVRRLQREGLAEEPLRSILSHRNAAGWWYMNSPAGVYKKYQGWVWSLLFAAELGAPPDHPEFHQSCEHFLKQCFIESTGALEMGRRPGRTFPCFVAHACTALAHFGFLSDERVERSYRWLAETVGADGGMRCFVMETCLNDTCVMAIPKFLKAASVLPPRERRQWMGDSPQRAIQRLLDVDIDRYQPVELADWQKATAGRSVSEIRKMRRRLSLSGERRRKPSWMRFQFPLHYDSDLIEALIYLGRLEVKPTAVTKAAAERLRQAGTPEGWKAKRSLDGKMWANLPFQDDWIALRALEALSYYG